VRERRDAPRLRAVDAVAMRELADRHVAHVVMLAASEQVVQHAMPQRALRRIHAIDLQQIEADGRPGPGAKEACRTELQVRERIEANADSGRRREGEEADGGQEARDWDRSPRKMTAKAGFILLQRDTAGGVAKNRLCAGKFVHAESVRTIGRMRPSQDVLRRCPWASPLLPSHRNLRLTDFLTCAYLTAV